MGKIEKYNEAKLEQKRKRKNTEKEKYIRIRTENIKTIRSEERQKKRKTIKI